MTYVEQELTAAQEEEAIIQERQKNAKSLAAQTIKGLAFPIDQAVQEKLLELKSGNVNYVQMVRRKFLCSVKIEVFRVHNTREMLCLTDIQHDAGIISIELKWQLQMCHSKVTQPMLFSN